MTYPWKSVPEILSIKATRHRFLQAGCNTSMESMRSVGFKWVGPVWDFIRGTDRQQVSLDSVSSIAIIISVVVNIIQYYYHHYYYYYNYYYYYDLYHYH